jgi:hypothetical protein
MTQTRLNSLAVSHVHQDLLDACCLDKVIELFISTCDSRIKLFGKRQGNVPDNFSSTLGHYPLFLTAVGIKVDV